MLEVVTALALAALAFGTGGLPAVRWPTLSIGGDPDRQAVFEPAARAVSNWRREVRSGLEPAPLAVAASFASGRPVVTRCVKLNNPWCIKRARWPGEIGADDEDHTAFASVAAGADAAATLLRTYYVTLGRRSALDIVRRWAPAECRIGILAGLPVTLAVRGLGSTLRARFLAARGRTGTAQPRRGRAAAAPRVSRVPPAALPSFRVPDIAGGLGERPRPAGLDTVAKRRTAGAVARVRVVIRVASLGTGGAGRSIPPVSACGSEEGRIGSYAGAIATALGVRPGDDLKLFDAGGEPTANLLPVLVAMSNVELGYLHAAPQLVEGAIERLKGRLATAAAAADHDPAKPVP